MSTKLISIIILIVVILYGFCSGFYFNYNQSTEKPYSVQSATTIILLPIVLLSTVLLAIISTKSEKTSVPNSQSNTVPMMNPETENYQEMQKIDTTGLGEALYDAGWRVVFADWCGFCKKQKELFAEHPEGNFNKIIIEEEEAKKNDDIKDRIDGFPAWVNIKDKSKDSPGYKGTIQEIVELLD